MDFMNQLNGLAIENNIKENLILHSLNNVRNMEVIDFRDGSKLGIVKDVVLDITESKVKSIVLPTTGKGWFGREDEVEIPWENIKKVGVDVIIVDTTNLEIFHLRNNM